MVPRVAGLPVLASMSGTVAVQTLKSWLQLTGTGGLSFGALPSVKWKVRVVVLFKPVPPSTSVVPLGPLLEPRLVSVGALATVQVQGMAASSSPFQNSTYSGAS